MLADTKVRQTYIMMIGTVSREGKAKENASKISTMQVRNNLIATPEMRLEVVEDALLAVFTSFGPKNLVVES